MYLSTTKDIDAPIESVFDQLTQFENFERAAMHRGAEVRRRGDVEHFGVGMAWDLGVVIRGKARKFVVDVARLSPPTELVVNLDAGDIAGVGSCELFALSRNRTRSSVTIELRALSLPARLLIQSLRLSKGRLTQKLDDRFSDLVNEIEAAHRKEA
jgi:uncharacterized protein YndB with AHSA1/START domain